MMPPIHAERRASGALVAGQRVCHPETGETDVGDPEVLTLRRVLMWTAVAIGLVAAACTPAPTPTPGEDPGAEVTLLPLRATRGTDAGLFDSAGRQVTLRGANFNQLGDYFVTDPRLPTVATLDDADWDDAQAMGFNVVRLVTTWSAWEPVRGQYDLAYAAQVRAAVEEANAHGMYALVDLHQDAWSKFVYSPIDHVCPAGWQRTRGWDGAPDWATFTDGAETCSPDGRRENPPAVRQAWNNFYANREGIRDAFGDLWYFIASQFAGDPGVAGFDLLNEPGLGSSFDYTASALSSAYADAINNIREAEQDVAPGAPTHPVFFEPVFGGFPLIPFDFSDDDNLVFAPHTYAESFDDIAGFLDLSMQGYRLAADAYRTPVFLGEYGAYRSDEFNRGWASRVHRLADELGFVGDTWWQWEQACGDPHNTSYPLSEDEVLRRLPSCADSRSIQACPTRPYPRAVPGRLTSLQAEPCGSGPLSFTGSTAAPSTADVWFPSTSPTPPTVTGTGVESATPRAVPGGWRIAVRVDGDYTVEVS
jgi:endoglycosylceramidase